MIAVKTEQFEGPLSLLLQLIEAEKMDITEIALAKIADQFLKYLELSPNIHPEEMADFLVVAAKLIYIKSKALLPYLILGEEDDDDAADLERQLKMYKEFVDAGEVIKEIIATNQPLYSPGLNLAKKNRAALISGFYPPEKVNQEVLASGFLRLVEKLRPLVKQLPETSLEPKVNLEDRISLIKVMVGERLRVNFSKMMASAKNKTELVVNFLAVLELAKQREIFFEQSELFGEIHLLHFSQAKEEVI